MKLHICKMIGALALQFTEAPHYVDFTYKTADGSVVVNFKSGGAPSMTTTSGKIDGKKVTTVTVIVPTNGGLRTVFGGEFSDDTEALSIGKVIQEALKAFEDYKAADNKPVVL